MVPTLILVAALLPTIAAQSCVTVSGGGGSCTGSSSAILSGQNNAINADRAAIVTGFAATASNTGAVVLGGQFNTASGSNALVGGGQFSRAQGDFTVAFGSFGQAVHDGSIVLAARSGVEALGDNVSLHCTSSGENTVSICSKAETGVFVNGINLIAELQSKFDEGTALAALQNLQDQINNVESDVALVKIAVAFNEAFFNATFEVLRQTQEQLEVNQNLTEELDQIKAELTALTANFEKIDAACLVQGRRLEQANPCTAIIVDVLDLAIVVPSAVGGALLMLLALILYRRELKSRAIKPRPFKGEPGSMFVEEQGSTGSSTVMPPPPYPPPPKSEDFEERPPTAPFRVRRPKRKEASPPSWLRGVSSSKVYRYILRSSNNDQREDGFEESAEERRDPTLPVFGQGPSGESSDEDEEVDSLNETIF